VENSKPVNGVATDYLYKNRIVSLSILCYNDESMTYKCLD